MVFSFFKKAVPIPAPVDETISPDPGQEVASISSTSKLAGLAQTQLQLRTPSPSVHSRLAAQDLTTSPAPTTSNNSTYDTSTRRVSVSCPPEPDNLLPVSDATPESLSNLVTSVPAKTLHSYVLTRLPHAEEPVLKSLAVFFEYLTPPPKLHCMRCHKDYVEVENDDRSCLVPHDDESAEVERVGRTGEGRKTSMGMEYETLWGCCGKTTEGDGNQGPPDGWCYEGKHTTDIKRARFRADSTLQNDKLVSCLRLNCHDVRSQLPRATTRKRARASMNYKEASEDEDGSEGEADSGMDEIVGNVKVKAKGKGKSKAKAKASKAYEDQMDVDGDDTESPSKSITKETPNPPRKRGRARKSQLLAKETDEESVSVKSAPVNLGPKRRGKPPKSRPMIEDSDEEEPPRGRKSAASSPTRGELRTRSASHGRQAAGSKLETPAKRAKSRTRAANRTDDEEDRNEEKPKKKRKTAS